MKTTHSWLLTLVAIALTSPLVAEEINAPDLHWHYAQTAGTATINWARVSEDAVDLAQNQQSSQPAQGNTGVAPSSSPAPPASVPPQTPQTKGDHEKAEEQIKQQEKQRVLGIVPSFNVSYVSDAVSLTRMQKIRLAFRSGIDPVTFATAFAVAGYHEAANDLSGFPWGPKGYGERAGVAYLDTLNGNMIGNGILPALLHQEPRYFRLGHGTVTHRILYAAATAFICKHDNTGKWEPNYSNVLGNMASGALSNLYYPDSNSGFGLTISNGMIQTAEGAAGAMFQEFWPDISRRLFHKDPTHGRDAQSNSDGNSESGVPKSARQ